MDYTRADDEELCVNNMLQGGSEKHGDRLINSPQMQRGPKRAIYDDEDESEVGEEKGIGESLSFEAYADEHVARIKRNHQIDSPSRPILPVDDEDEDLRQERANIVAAHPTSSSTISDTVKPTTLSGTSLVKTNKCIALIDLDCFFVAVERMLDPSLVGLPVAVGQYTKGETLIAVSYEAKALGVKRGMFGFQARKVCPQLRIVQVQVKHEKADLTKYRDASSKVLAIATRFCSRVERASVDEFYLDLTEEALKEMKADSSETLEFAPSTLFCTSFDQVAESSKDVETSFETDRIIAAGTRIIYKIRMAIKDELGLDCSAGIASNRFLAKSIAGIRKPATHIALVQSCIPSLCATMPINKARSLGGKLGDHLKETYGVEHLGDLEKLGESTLCNSFGTKEGKRLFALSRGQDDTAVESRVLPKSLGCSKTFPGQQCLTSRSVVLQWLEKLARELVERLEKDGRRPSTVTVSAYELGSRSTSSFKTAKITLETLMPTIETLFDRLIGNPARISEMGGIHSLGLNLSGFPEDAETASSATLAVSLSKWTCPSCTFENESKWLKCEACGSSKSGYVPSSSSSLKKDNSTAPPVGGLLAFAVKKQIKQEQEVTSEQLDDEAEVQMAEPPEITTAPGGGLLAFAVKKQIKQEQEVTNEQVDDEDEVQMVEPSVAETKKMIVPDRSIALQAKQAAAKIKFWACRVCTYAQNDARFLRCELCNTSRNNLL